jgi:hypothetical protein
MGTKSKQIKTNGKKTHRNQKIPIKCVRCKESFFVKINSIDYMDWKNGEKIKKIPELNSYAMIVEKIQGKPIIYTTSEIYDLSLSGKFELAADWLDYEPRKIQSAILEKYNNNNDKENGKLAELFRSLQQIKNFYKIDLVDFQDNIIDEGNRYVIVDLGF